MGTIIAATEYTRLSDAADNSLETDSEGRCVLPISSFHDYASGIHEFTFSTSTNFTKFKS